MSVRAAQARAVFAGQTGWGRRRERGSELAGSARGAPGGGPAPPRPSPPPLCPGICCAYLARWLLRGRLARAPGKEGRRSRAAAHRQAARRLFFPAEQQRGLQSCLYFFQAAHWLHPHHHRSWKEDPLNAASLGLYHPSSRRRTLPRLPKQRSSAASSCTVRMARGPPTTDPSKWRTAPLTDDVPLIPGSPYSVLVLRQGFARELSDGTTQADGTVSLVLGPHLTMVDTGGPWARDRLLSQLAEQGVGPGDIQHVVCTHGHSDHVGNLNLFPQADLILGMDFSQPGGRYLPTGLRQGIPYQLHAGFLEVLPTPGHTGSDISLMVRGTDLGDVLLAGDLFEREGDEGEWQVLSEDPARQAASRAQALALADVIVPGHGAPFQVFREGAPPCGKEGQGSSG